MDKLYEQTMLFDFYGELLTEHQRRVYADAVYNDMSLGEIAEEQGISRQGVHDLLRRCDKILQDYESRLHLVERFARAKETVKEIQELSAGTVEEVREPFKGTRKEIQELSAGTAEEIRAPFKGTRKEIQELSAGTGKEIREPSAGRGKEIGEPSAGTAEEAGNLSAVKEVPKPSAGKDGTSAPDVLEDLTSRLEKIGELSRKLIQEL